MAADAAVLVKPPSARDVAAARAIVADLTRFDQTALRRRGQMRAAAGAFVAGVRARCAGALPASLDNTATQQQDVLYQLVIEGAFDLAVNTTRPLDPPALALAHRLDRVRFANRSLTVGLRQLAHLQRVSVAMDASDLCADVSEAEAVGYAALPAGTTALMRRVDRLESASAPTVTGLLTEIAPYLTGRGDRAAAKRLRGLQSTYERFARILGEKEGARLGSVLTATSPAGGRFPTQPSGQAAAAFAIP
ncbi:MAG: hypothetical protein ACXVRM_08090 [Solirubrobacteraceae bacterium]